MRKKYKWALLCLKYIPVIMFMLMWIHTWFLLAGRDPGIADTMVGCAVLPSILILSLSTIFQYCLIHKSITIYALVVDILMNVQRYIGLGMSRRPMQIVVAFIGLILFSILLFSKCLTKYGCVNTNTVTE